MNGHYLILLRHGKSDWSAGEPDFDRPLNKRGRKAVPKMGRWLKQHGPVPERIISSPARRALDSAELMAEALGLKRSAVVRDRRIYDAGLSGLRQVLDSDCKEADCVMLVGHNPGLDELLNHLAAEPPPRNGAGKLMTTAALAILDYGESPVGSTPGSAVLKELKRPKEL